MIRPMTITRTFIVDNDDQAQELDAAWHEIKTGMKHEKITRAEALAYDLKTVTERVHAALEGIQTSLREKPTLHGWLVWLEERGIEPPIHLIIDDQQLSRLSAVALRTGQDRNTLLLEAINVMLTRYETREYGCLVLQTADYAYRKHHGERPVTHAERLSYKGPASPVCGAPGIAWIKSRFRFEQLDCEACRDIVLGYAPQECVSGTDKITTLT
jgi:hypothetical protein